MWTEADTTRFDTIRHEAQKKKKRNEKRKLFGEKLKYLAFVIYGGKGGRTQQKINGSEARGRKCKVHWLARRIAEIPELIESEQIGRFSRSNAIGLPLFLTRLSSTACLISCRGIATFDKRLRARKIEDTRDNLMKRVHRWRINSAVAAVKYQFHQLKKQSMRRRRWNWICHGPILCHDAVAWKLFIEANLTQCLGHELQSVLRMKIEIKLSS